MATSDERENLKDPNEALIGKRFDRRDLMIRAGALGLTAGVIGGLAPTFVQAQSATPEGAAGAGETVHSMTRDEHYAKLREAFAFEDPQNQGGQIIWSQTSDIATVNGLLTADYPTVYITGFIFEPLVSTSPIDGQIVPALADSYEIAPDGRTYTFHLNKNAKWHDGTDVTAEDLKFTYDVALDERSPNPRRSTILQQLESYRVIDDDTFEMVTTEPFATFLYDVPFGVFTMPKHIWEGVAPEAWPNDPGSTGQDPARVVGTGPFKFQEWRQGESVTLVRNDAYYDPQAVPVIDELVMRVLPDPATEVEALKAGEIDIIEVIPAPQVEEVQNTEGLKVEIYPGYSFSYIGLNMDPEKTTLFQDQRVRAALFIAIDKEAIKNNIYLGLGEVARGTQPKLSFAYAPERVDETYDYDPERAKQLLADAGWADTNGDGIVEKDGQDFRFELLLPSGGGAVTDQLLAELQQRWREIGVEMTPNLMEWSAMQDVTDKTHDFQALLQGFVWDPSGSQGTLFRCDSYEGGFNNLKYCNEEFDRLDDLQLRELDREKRRELLIEQSNIVWNDLPVLIYRFGVERPGFTDRLHNFFPTGNGGVYWSIPFVWIDA
jgi:peptide/nickel transport system substrate-binding protein